MSEILESYNFRSVGRECTYPYDDWFDGQIWKLTKGFDFECQPNSLRQAFYAAAKRRGIKVQVSILANGDVVIQNKGKNKV
jgi:hypothetical protein